MCGGCRVACMLRPHVPWGASTGMGLGMHVQERPRACGGGRGRVWGGELCVGKAIGCLVNSASIVNETPTLCPRTHSSTCGLRGAATLPLPSQCAGGGGGLRTRGTCRVDWCCRATASIPRRAAG